jgi:hypothetical protein
LPLRCGAGGVPLLAEREMALLADDVAIGVCGDARGEMVAEVVVGAVGGDIGVIEIGDSGSGGAAKLGGRLHVNEL